jgi:hypothetical protein
VGVRWARGAFGVVDNLTKNLFALCHFRPELVLGLACGLTLFTLFPLAACLAGPAMWWPAGTLLIAFFLAYQRAGRVSPLLRGADGHVSSCRRILLLYALLRSMFLALWHGGILLAGNVLLRCANCDSGRRKPVDDEHARDRTSPRHCRDG